eukprot:scaffold192_cov331-Pavlova_lutheri.AAC.1
MALFVRRRKVASVVAWRTGAGLRARVRKVQHRSVPRHGGGLDPKSAALHTIRCSKPGNRIYWLDLIEGSNGQKRPSRMHRPGRLCSTIRWSTGAARRSWLLAILSG